MTYLAPPNESSRISLPNWLATLCAALVVMFAMGCDTTGDALTLDDQSQQGPVRMVASQTSPRATIEQCVRAYQRLTTYADEAYVRLRYELDGKLLEDRAPLSVAWDKQGLIGLHAYSVQAGPTLGRWRLSLNDDEVFPHQVLSRALPSQLNFEWLLADPMVAERLSAGLAGSPPQLDLLLNPHPLSGLVNDSAALSYLPPESIDNRACFVIQVQTGPAQFVLWIDQASLLLRRMRLPQTHLTEQMLADKRVANVELIIELANISTSGEIDWRRFAVPESSEQLLVHRFVPRPPQVDTSDLGEQIPAFQLESPDGKTVFGSSEPRVQRKATVLMWLADHPSCRLASEQLNRVAQELLQHNVPAGAVEFVTVWAEPQPPEGSSFPTLASDWNMPGQLAWDRQALGRDLFHVLEAPTVVVVDKQNRLQLRESRSNPVLDQVLPELLRRIVAGENLAEELVAKQQLVEKRYEAELRMAAASDGQRSQRFPQPVPYAPEAFTLREIARDSFPHPALAVATDAEQSMWILLNNGQLQQILNTSSAPDYVTHKTTWRPENRPGIRMAIGPDSENIALCWNNSSQIALHNVVSGQSRMVSLDAAAKVVDMQWLMVGSPSSPRLSAITREGQTVLIDPSNREQLSGQSAHQPVAIVSHRGSAHSLDGLIIMDNGHIENLQYSADSLPSSTSGLVRPAGTASTLAGSTAPPSTATTPPAARVSFQPDVGPWQSWRDATHELTLARGWLATDEPAVFMLDEQLNRRWHYRMPVHSAPAWSSVTTATDPRSGQPFWAIASADQTIHLLRADGLIIDHFRPEEPVVGVALIPNGDRLELSLVHPDERIRYELVGL